MALTAGASRIIAVEVVKPLGLTLVQKSGGGVVTTVSPYYHFPSIKYYSYCQSSSRFLEDRFLAIIAAL